jgi:hypothetical protein
MTRKNFFVLSLILAATAVSVLLLAPPENLAQGCALCYQSAAASGPRLIQALRDGIFILMAPPAAICLGITWLAWRRRNLHNQAS